MTCFGSWSQVGAPTWPGPMWLCGPVSVPPLAQGLCGLPVPAGSKPEVLCLPPLALLEQLKGTRVTGTQAGVDLQRAPWGSRCRVRGQGTVRDGGCPLKSPALALALSTCEQATQGWQNDICY